MVDDRPVRVKLRASIGGQGPGLELAGSRHIAFVELEEDHCEAVTLHRPCWNVMLSDVRYFDGRDHYAIDLVGKS